MAGNVPSLSPDIQPQRTFRAFTHRGYVCLWLANFLLYTSRWMQMTLLAWLILDLTDSPFLVALVGFFSSAPMFLLGLVGGILADRVRRQRPRSRRRPLSATQHNPTTSLVGISFHCHEA